VSTVWTAIAAAAVVSFVIKAAGPALVGDRDLPPWSMGIIGMLAPALLAGLVVVDVFGPGWSSLDATVIAGLAATAAATLLRAPMLVAVLAGIAATALLRLAFG